MAQRRKTTEHHSRSPDPVPAMTCCRCGRIFPRGKSYYHPSYSTLYRATGYLPLCSDCVDAIYDRYLDETRDRRAAMRRVCMKLDIYWTEGICDAIEQIDNGKSYARNYIGKIGRTKFKGKTYDDTLRDEAYVRQLADADAASPPPPPAAPEVDDEEKERLEAFWGPGFDLPFYLEVERRYREWTDGVDVRAPNVRGLYKQICMLEVSINREYQADGKPADKVRQYNELLGSMNLKPTQQREDGDASAENTPFGVWIRRWENERPVPEPDPELRDVDGVVRYVSIWFLGHLCKMLGIRNTYCRMYEEEIARLRVERLEDAQEEDDEEIFEDIFSISDDAPEEAP